MMIPMFSYIQSVLSEIWTPVAMSISTVELTMPLTPSMAMMPMPSSVAPKPAAPLYSGKV